MFSKKIFSVGLVFVFLFSLLTFTSCGGSKNGYQPSKSRVKSGSGMGNSRQKNKHVWGK